jgi:hypothetical protein
MGRVLFEITPVPAVLTRRAGSVSGLATCRVDLIEAADNAFGADFPDSVRNLRQRVAPDGSVRSKPPEEFMTITAEAVVPPELLATLPDAALLAFRWGFTPASSSRPQKGS